MKDLYSHLCEELSKPRPLPPQVADHLVAHHEVSQDQLADFLGNKLLLLEEYEVDLILSPMFTPGLPEQALFSRHVLNKPLSELELINLVQLLVQKPVTITIEFPGEGSIIFPLPAGQIDRYVRRLNLQTQIDPSLASCIRDLVPPTDLDWVHAIGRRPVWNQNRRHEILKAALTRSIEGGLYSRDTMTRFLTFVEQYKPADLAEIVELIPDLIRGFETQISQDSAPKPFFNDRLRDLHGYDRDQRARDEKSIASRQQLCVELALWKKLFSQAQAG